MRTKLFGVFVAGLAIAALAALPASAFAEEEPVTLRTEEKVLEREGAELNFSGSNVKFTGSSNGLAVECATARIHRTGRLDRNTARRVHFQNSKGGELCATNTGGRIEAKVEDVRFSEMNLYKESGSVHSNAPVKFTLRFYDKGLSEIPIAACTYSGSFLTTGALESDEAETVSGSASLLSGTGVCSPEQIFSGEVSLASEGIPIRID
jgi:hypothetical protein